MDFRECKGTGTDTAETAGGHDELLMEMDDGILNALCGDPGFRAVTADGIVITADSDESLQAIINKMDELREERNAASALATDWADRYAQLVRMIVDVAIKRDAQPEGISGGDPWA